MLRVLPHTFKPALQQIRLRGFFFVVRKTRNLASQLVLQKSHKTSCTFFVARFIVPQDKTDKRPLASRGKVDQYIKCTYDNCSLFRFQLKCSSSNGYISIFTDCL